MRNQPYYKWSLALLVSVLPLAGGCLQQASSAPQTQAETNTVVATGESTNASASLAEDGVMEEPAIDISEAPVKAVAAEKPLPANVRTNGPAAEVIKLAESGVDESVLLVYVTNAPSMFSLSAEEIIYLNDIGVPSTVVTAMLQHDQALKTAPAQSVWAESPATEGTDTPAAAEIAPQQAAAAPPPQQPAQEVAPAPATQPTYSTFYQTLAPYGTWVEVDGYGLVWQPTVVVSRPSWRPYFDNGRWVYSDYGWYWASDYSWGWAPFHYGRWFRHHHLGWCWYPGYTWGPSWVSWRYTDGYCGWAPLPPSAVYRPGFGLTYWGRHVGVTFGFGLGYDSFSFISWNHFHHRHLYRYHVHHDHARRIYHDSVVSTRIVGSRDHVFNRGLAADHVSRVTKTPVQRVAVRDTSNIDGRALRGDRLAADGKSLTAYRPRFPEATASTRPARTEPVTAANRSGVVRSLSPEKAPSGSLKPVATTFSRMERPAANEIRRPVPAASLASPGERPNGVARVEPLATRPTKVEARETATSVQTRPAANPFARTESSVRRDTRLPAPQTPPQTTTPASPGTRPPVAAATPARPTPAPTPNVTQNWQTRPSTAAPAARNELAARSPWSNTRQSTAPSAQRAAPSTPQPAAPTPSVPRAAEAQRSAPAPAAPRYAPAPAPAQTQPRPYNTVPAAPSRSYQPPPRVAEAPRYNPPAYSAPPAAPQREFRAPTPSPQPSRPSYQAPSPSYQAPSRSYSPPPAAPSYSAPSRPAPSASPSPSRPAPSSGGSGDSRGGRNGWSR